MINDDKKNSTVPWSEKYRPEDVSEMAQAEHLLAIGNTDSTKKNNGRSHILLHGPPGTGKTTFAHALGKQIFGTFYDERVTELNASDERGIDSVRKRILQEVKKHVCAMVTKDGMYIPPYKILILDEADSMTEEAQDALRVIIERYSKVTRFCFICNYPNKITEAIKSRCMSIYFKKLDNDVSIKKLKDIAGKENMSLPDNIYQGIVDIADGDMRKATTMLQNLKYLHDYKKLFTSPIKDLNAQEIMIISTYDNVKGYDPEISIQDLYDISCTISPKDVRQILREIAGYTSLRQVRNKTVEVTNRGLSVDNIMNQVIKEILKHNMDPKKKAALFLKLRESLHKVKDDANDYLQLLHFFSNIYVAKIND